MGYVRLVYSCIILIIFQVYGPLIISSVAVCWLKLLRY